ncbi:MAG: HDOD domain-containing protein [Verrucomicrobia bacterium]|nr:HDOD domain-containing protein [Verrucomicrobiota bacterium]
MDKADQYIDAVAHLPPSPTLVVELLVLFKEPDRDVDRVVELVSHDPSLTAEILKRCNSALLAGRGRAADIFEAVSRLGFYEVYCVVVAVFGASTRAMPGVAEGVDVGALWRHSVTAAAAASTLAEASGEAPGAAFTAGLLHDAGKLVFASVERSRYGELLKAARATKCSPVDAEKIAFGLNHAELGGRLLARWNLPPEVVAAVWHHHAPPGPQPLQKWVAIAHLANLMAHRVAEGREAEDPATAASSLGVLKLGAADVPVMIARTQKALERVKGLMEI